MKKIMFSLLMAFAIFFVNVNNTEAQCPAGYTPTTRIISVGGCAFEVSICYKCDVTGLTPNWVYAYALKKVNPSCTPTISERQIIGAIKNIMTSGTFLNSLCGSEDCETANKKKYNFIFPRCLKKTNYETYPGSGIYALRIVDCDPNTYCLEEYEVCTDYTFPEPRIESTYLDSTPYGTTECDDTIPSNPSQGNESTCFRNYTKCDE